MTVRRRGEPHPEADYDNPTPGHPPVGEPRVAVSAALPTLPDPPAETVVSGDAAALHRLLTQGLNYSAKTRCGITVAYARTTRRDSDVTCGNCQRAAP